MTQVILRFLAHAAFLAILLLAGCSANYCGDLVYNDDLNTCECPEGSTPDYDVDACVFPNGTLIPWAGFNVAGQDSGLALDAGTMDPDAQDARPDANPVDAGIDPPPTDAGRDVIPAPDAGPPPENVVARFPPNGFATGSVHVPEAASVANHPLRPLFIWEPVADAEHYQIQLTRECEVSGFLSCAFAAMELDQTTADARFRPEASLAIKRTRPVGDRYFWRVRACGVDLCSDWTQVRYLDVGRDNHDFNGDGYADVLAGAFAQNAPANEEGNVFVYFGGAGGVAASASVTLDSPANQAYAHFGRSVSTAGDVNGDGYADLIVGADGQDAPENDEGQVFVYLGGPAGPSLTPHRSLDNPLDQTGGGFGAAVANAGDVNGDGYADVLVGAPRQDNVHTDEGMAYVFFGSAEGTVALPAVSLSNPVPQEDGRFGNAVSSAGDMNGDGYLDLLIGADGQAAPEDGEGNVFIFLGSEDGPAESPEVSLDNPTDHNYGRFGFSVAGALDIDGDGFSDIAVGAIYQAAPERNEGNAFAYLGSRSEIVGGPGALDNPADELAAYFGYSISSAGDLNGDGYGDMMVGATGQGGTRAGAAFVYLDRPPLVAPNTTLEPQFPRSHGAMGTASALAGDINGDGYSDIVVGASPEDEPGADDTYGGNIFVFLGSPEGPPAAPHATLENPTGQVSGKFGASL